MKIVFELPFYSKTVGGINDSIFLARKLGGIIRFQRLIEYPQIDLSWSVGKPDFTFPECDVCITYSDNPFLKELVELPQIKRVILYMLSYGMSIERERANILNKKVRVICSSEKIERLIKKDGGNVTRVGIGLDVSNFYETEGRKKYFAILYNDSSLKRYNFAVKVADKLYANKQIEGVITFGNNYYYDRFIHPRGLRKHYPNATKEEIRNIFNICSCFLMPSISEGINLTPIESTLCGCPSIICDGAIDEIFFHGKNCFIAKKDDISGMIDLCTNVINHFNDYSLLFKENMKEIIKDKTWDKVINNIINLL